MSDTSNCNKITNSITKPIDKIEQKTDSQLKEADNDYKRRDILKWVILVLLIIILVFLALGFIYKVCISLALQQYLINQIANNIVFITLAVFTILKINIPTKF